MMPFDTASVGDFLQYPSSHMKKKGSLATCWAFFNVFLEDKPRNR